MEKATINNLLPCPFCGNLPERWTCNDIFNVACLKCVSVGFHNHVRFGCWAEGEWNKREGENENNH
jgi:hypothetical protein